jgi:hypothetical protein
MNNHIYQNLNSELTPQDIRTLKLRKKKYEEDPSLRPKLERLEAMIPRMPHGVPLPLKKIYTKLYWEPIGIGYRSYIGEYIACLVATKQLPLVLVGRKNNSNLYRRG